MVDYIANLIERYGWTRNAREGLNTVYSSTFLNTVPPFRILIRSLQSTIAPVGPADAGPTEDEVHARWDRAMYVTLCVTTLLRIHLVDPWIAEESSRWPCLREALGEIFVYGHMVVQVSNLEFGRGLIMLHRHHTRITRSLAGLETAAYVTTTPPTCTAPTTSTSAVVGYCTDIVRDADVRIALQQQRRDSVQPGKSALRNFMHHSSCARCRLETAIAFSMNPT